jgi:hypothetical protein
MKNQTTYSLLICAFFALGLFSCKKEDENPSNKSIITGLWKLKSENIVVFENGKQTENETENGEDGETYEFKADGSLITIDGKLVFKS